MPMVDSAPMKYADPASYEQYPKWKYIWKLTRKF